MYKEIITIVFLFIVSNFYLKIANRYNIIDKPNERSSHSRVIVRGGGVIFPISIILWGIINSVFNPFIIGLTLISIISFIDDCKPLSNKVRLLIHFLSIILIIYQLDFSDFSFFICVLGLFFIAGWINAFNFMDGINGITVLYAFTLLASLNYLNSEICFVPNSLIEFTCLGLFVFSYYNLRKNALAFPGDVGSVSIAFILAFIIISLILTSSNWQYILLASLYGIDSLVTIIQRALKNENIFNAHRTHLYQYLANEVKWPHIAVSLFYATSQLFLNICLILLIIPMKSNFLAISYLIVQGLAYLIIKNKLIKSLKSK